MEGQILITTGASSGTINLSTDAPGGYTLLDWVHFGATASLNADNYELGGTGLSRTVSGIGSGFTYTNYNDNGMGFTWADGANSPSNTAGSSTPSYDGLYATNFTTGYGFDLTTTALTAGKTYELRLYTQAYNTVLQVTATLSDGTTSSDNSVSSAGDNPQAQQYFLDFTPTQASETLDIKVTNQTINGSFSNAAIVGYSLSAVPEPPIISLLGLGLIGMFFYRRHGLTSQIRLGFPRHSGGEEGSPRSS